MLQSLFSFCYFKAFSARNCGPKKQDQLSTDQLCMDQKNHTPKKASIDLKFFMEESENQEDSVYATLDDHVDGFSVSKIKTF